MAIISIDDVQKQLWEREKEFLTKQIALMLMKDKAIKFGDFTLTSGKKSPYYLDLRLILSEPITFDWITNSMVRIIINEIGKDKADRILGVPTAGVPFATSVAQKLGIPLIYVRKERKEHGAKKQVEGKLERNDRIVIIDDLITTGKSAVKYADVIKEEGGIVNEVVILVDREQGGPKNLAEIGVKVHSLFKVSDIFNWLHDVKLLPDEDHKTLTEYINTEKGA